MPDRRQLSLLTQESGGLSQVISKRLTTFLHLAMLISAAAGCGESKQAKEARLAERAGRKWAVQEQIDANQLKIESVERAIAELNKVLAGREKKWRDSVTARHPNWSPQFREQQIGILEHKWWNSNRTKDEDTVREMRTFASRWYSLGGVSVDLRDEDYWDIARNRSANWGTEAQIKELSRQLETLQTRMRTLQRDLDALQGQ